MIPATLVCSGALTLAGAAAYTDARTGHIPNWITVPPLIVAPLLHGVWGGMAALGIAVAAIFLCGLVPYIMFRAGAAGGGDVKLLAALGAVGGPGFGLEAQLFGYGFAVLAALMLLTWRGKLARTLANSLFLALNPVLPRRCRRPIVPEAMSTIRLGVPILAGVVVVVWLRSSLLGL